MVCVCVCVCVYRKNIYIYGENINIRKLGGRMTYCRNSQTISVKGCMVNVLAFAGSTFYSNYSTFIAAEKQP